LSDLSPADYTGFPLRETILNDKKLPRGLQERQHSADNAYGSFAKENLARSRHIGGALERESIPDYVIEVRYLAKT
jgi:hypothetical protein